MTDSTKALRASALYEPVSEELRQLIAYCRCSDAPDEALSEALAHIQKASAALEPWQRQGKGWSTISIAGENPDLEWSEDDITRVMPFSPVSGKRSAVAPPIKLWKVGEEIFGEATFSPTYAGPPDSVHGGIIAAVFDEVLAMANVITGNAGFTGTLTIKYHSTTPLNTPIELWGANLKQDGRKQLSRGEMRVNGKVTASAEGLFICAPELGSGDTAPARS